MCNKQKLNTAQCSFHWDYLFLYIAKQMNKNHRGKRIGMFSGHRGKQSCYRISYHCREFPTTLQLEFVFKRNFVSLIRAKFNKTGLFEALFWNACIIWNIRHSVDNIGTQVFALVNKPSYVRVVALIEYFSFTRLTYVLCSAVFLPAHMLKQAIDFKTF